MGQVAKLQSIGSAGQTGNVTLCCPDDLLLAGIDVDFGHGMSGKTLRLEER